MKCILTFAVILGCGLFGAEKSANAVLIDSFSEPASGTSIALPGNGDLGTVENETGVTTGSGILGGSRDYLISQTGSAGASAYIDTPAGAFVYTTSGNVAGGFMLQWDGGATAPSSAGSEQFTDATNGLDFGLPGVPVGDRVFIFDTIASAGFNTLGGVFDLTFTIYESSTSFASATYTTTGSPERIVIAGPTVGLNSGTVLGLPIDTRFDTFGGSFDVLTSPINAITLQGAAPSPGGTLIITNFAAVPEPTSIALLGMGTCGLIGYGWRRKKKVVTE